MPSEGNFKLLEGFLVAMFLGHSNSRNIWKVLLKNEEFANKRQAPKGTAPKPILYHLLIA